MKAAIKREQSQTCLNFAEREQSQRSQKGKREKTLNALQCYSATVVFMLVNIPKYAHNIYIYIYIYKYIYYDFFSSFVVTV